MNFFDNAEAYAGGESRARSWARRSPSSAGRAGPTCISTKVFWGIHDGANMRNTLNRKYLMQAIDGLRSSGSASTSSTCSSATAPTRRRPIEETVWAMSDIIARGKALYWGTSEWTADEIRAAWEIAERHHLHKPVMEQPQYNLLERRRVEHEYARLYDDIGLGLTTWSPLASGLLTGKYLDGVPDDSRAALPGLRVAARACSPTRAQREGARGCRRSPTSSAARWPSSPSPGARPTRNVSTVITGASRVEQVHENLKALDVLDALDPDMLDRIDAALAG